MHIVETRRAVVTWNSNTKNKEDIYSVNAGVLKCRITSPDVSLPVVVSPILAHRVHVRVSTHVPLRFNSRAVLEQGEPFINRKKTDKWGEGVSVARGPGRNQPTSNRESSLGRGIRAAQFGRAHFFCLKFIERNAIFSLPPLSCSIFFDTCSKKRK